MGQMGLDESTFTILREGDRPARSKTISKAGLETESLGRSTSSAEEPVGKRACSDRFYRRGRFTQSALLQRELEILTPRRSEGRPLLESL
jgi:hypothetical protein